MANKPLVMAIKPVLEHAPPTLAYRPVAFAHTVSITRHPRLVNDFVVHLQHF